MDDYIVSAKGGRKLVEPENGATYTLAELQKAVGGYIELVHLGRPDLLSREKVHQHRRNH